ncbi:hypothetical protein [Streptomyces mirabilis]|uniref:hypothetical protein n=1 Tax=Streptomyces mirabilis TaxID=68239 RepID=UPI00331905FA
MRRSSQRCLSAVAGLAAALVVAPPASAATSTPYSRPDTQQRTQVFQLVAKQTQSESLDLGKKGLSRGDELVIAVTGGSGAFGSARGYVHTVPAGKAVRNLTFHITLDASSGT